MKNEKRDQFLLLLAIFTFFITIILFFIDIFLIFCINSKIYLNQIFILIFYISLISLETTRIILLSMSALLILLTYRLNIFKKFIMIFTLFIGIIYNSYFLFRLFTFNCFAPIFSFITNLLIYLSFALILILNLKQL